MNRTIALASLATLLIAGPAVAQEHRAEPSAPQSIAAMRDGSAATIGGKIIAVLENGFIVEDDSGQAFVQAEGFQDLNLHPGDLVTVTGHVEDYDIDAQHIIRDDGSVAEIVG